MSSALVIEDDRAQSDLLCQLLRLLGISPRPAYTPRAALLSLEDDLPDLVFIDLDLSNGEGFELLACLGEEISLATIPMVIITRVDEAAIACFKQGIKLVGVFHPPITLQDVTQVLERTGVV